MNFNTGRSKAGTLYAVLYVVCVHGVVCVCKKMCTLYVYVV
jgi:hypothetical protein